MEKIAAQQAYRVFLYKMATAAGKVLDSGAGSDLPPELRGAGVGALAGGIPGAALGGALGSGLKARLLMAALMGGTGALGGGLLGAGAGAIGRAATDPEDEDRLTGGSPIARGALLGGAGLGGVGAGVGGAIGSSIEGLGAMHRRMRRLPPRSTLSSIGNVLGAAAMLGLPAAGLGAGVGAGAGALRKALSKDEEE